MLYIYTDDLTWLPSYLTINIDDIGVWEQWFKQMSIFDLGGWRPTAIPTHGNGSKLET